MAQCPGLIPVCIVSMKPFRFSLWWIILGAKIWYIFARVVAVLLHGKVLPITIILETEGPPADEATRRRGE